MGRVRWIVLIMVVVVGVALAIRLADVAYGRRNEQMEAIARGHSEPPPPPPKNADAPPPLDRATSRGEESVVVSRVAAGDASGLRRVVVIRGNGEFTRLPALRDEPGPLVRGILDREEVDRLIRRTLDGWAAESRPDGDLSITVSTRAGRQTRRANSTAAATILGVTGRNLTRNALPSHALLTTTRAAGPSAESEPAAWPLPRQKPADFATGRAIVPDADRTRFAAALATLSLGRTFHQGDADWTITGLDLLPPGSDP